MANSSVRLVLLHTGRTLKGAYTQFQYEDLKKMDKASGFILNPCTEYGVYGDDYEKHYGYLISQMDQLPPKTFYVGLPPVNIDREYTSKDCEHDFTLLNDFITRVFEEVEKLGKETRFKGFYFTTERIPGTVDVSSPTSNPMIKLMSDLSNLIRKTHKKQFLWAPYLGRYEMYHTINENIGIVANRTSIFNTIFLQSGYYFYPDRTRIEDKNDKENIVLRRNLALAQKSAQGNAVYNYKSSSSTVISNTPVGAQKTSATQIGIDMEAEDSLYWNPDTFKGYYSNECGTFGPLFLKGTCPFLFYAGSYNGIISCGLYQSIQEFYTNGGYKLPVP